MKRASIALRTVCGLEELDGHATAGISHILSILDPELADPVSFQAYDRHHRTVLRFHDIIEPQAGMILPTPDHVRQIIDFGDEMVEEAEEEGRQAHLLIHCHMGISRSTAAMAMMLLAADPDASEDEVMDRLFSIRSHAWPNALMIGFADEILGREGRLTAAVGRLYARQIALKPHLVEVFKRLGRAREVEMAQAA